MHKMNFRVFIVLIQIFTVSIRQLNVLANDIKSNETQSTIHKISTITTTATIVSETCNDRFCYNEMNDTTTILSNQSNEFAPLYQEYDQLKSTSILYGIVKIASKRPQTTKCYKELNQIYSGIHHKEIWAIKGRLVFLQK